MNDDVDDDDDFGGGSYDSDPTFSGPPPKRVTSETFTLKFIDKEWIRKLVQWADKNHALLLQAVMMCKHFEGIFH